MTTRRPRIVLTSAITLLIVVLGLLAIALVRADASARRDAEQRFSDRAQVSAAMTESLFSSSAGESAAQNARRFGGGTIDPGRLRAVARQGQLAYAMVVDERGTVLASTDGTPAAALERVAPPSSPLKAVLDGSQPVYLSDVLGGTPDALEYGLGFKTAYGRRAIVQGFRTKPLSDFLGGYLARIPGASNASAYILDAQGRVIGTPVKSQPTGQLAKEPGLIEALARGAREGKFQSGDAERSFAETPIANSSWRVVLSTKTSALYAGVNTLLQWLTLIGLAIAGGLAVIAIGRWARAAAAVHVANERLASSNVELERSNLELQRSNSELEQFASVASHDLQEPLRKVQTFGDQLEMRFGDQMPDEALDYLARMRRSAGRMSSLIEDLLRFSQVTTHARPHERVDLSVIAKDVVIDLEAALSDTRGSVDIGELPVVQADPLQMRQLMQNLIANAIKFHRPGVSPEVRVSAAPAPAGSVAFSVSDNGIGFEPRYGERIFRVFERLHPRDVFEGTGIGLALCRKIAERHGGTISGAGRPDEGSTFTVTLAARSTNGKASMSSSDHGVGDTREPVHV